jgi:hypothetical protein
VARCLLLAFDIEAFGFTRSVLSAATSVDVTPGNWKSLRTLRDASETFCPDEKATKDQCGIIRQAKIDKDTVGGLIECHIFNCPPGLGSCMDWRDKLDARLAYAVMGIQAIKSVEIGLGKDAASRPGSQVHDPIHFDPSLTGTPSLGFTRDSNNAGGTEGGMTNGQPVIIRAAMKPISTLLRGLPSIDLRSRQPDMSTYERSDICAVPAASVVLENVAAFEVAAAFRDKFRRRLAQRISGKLRELSPPGPRPRLARSPPAALGPSAAAASPSVGDSTIALAIQAIWSHTPERQRFVCFQSRYAAGLPASPAHVIGAAAAARSPRPSVIKPRKYRDLMSRACPKCGYGLVESRQTVDYLCPECGLTLPRASCPPNWSVEIGPYIQPRAFVYTLFAAFLPSIIAAVVVRPRGIARSHRTLLLPLALLFGLHAFIVFITAECGRTPMLWWPYGGPSDGSYTISRNPADIIFLVIVCTVLIINFWLSILLSRSFLPGHRPTVALRLWAYALPHLIGLILAWIIIRTVVCPTEAAIPMRSTLGSSFLSEVTPPSSLLWSSPKPSGGARWPRPSRATHQNERATNPLYAPHVPAYPTCSSLAASSYIRLAICLRCSASWAAHEASSSPALSGPPRG